ncbi:uncharacterized protein LOC124134540 isoform X2 [Haliotis rufescens]|uniref:uncharacterized protein LOC124134540 isoform X2 n=1 Tax=Haliotis rufescens TaxID=6454 RepID=UPI00201F0973|nr:uncharacterized protein LOC124134540 isoform X2 [Haliotis rufescens]
MLYQTQTQFEVRRGKLQLCLSGIIAAISVFGGFRELLLLKIVTTATHTTNMITMANMMLILLLITTSKCSNATQICVERNLTHCDRQEANGRCTLCHKGYYGPTCSSKCIGECDFQCDIDTGFCEQCNDTYYTKSCMVKCSETCGEQLCNRTTGECTNGCEKGHCSDFCKTPCDESCKDKECHFKSCKCQRCNDGYVCNEAAKGGNCTQCVKNTSDAHLPTINDCKKCNTTALVVMILAIVCLVGETIYTKIRKWKQSLMKSTPESRNGSGETARLSEDSDSPLEPQEIDPGEFPNAYPFTGIQGRNRYIMTQLPSTRERDDEFLRMIWKYDIKVIVFISSGQSRMLDGYLTAPWRNTPRNSLVLTAESGDNSDDWTLGFSENGMRKTAHLYHHPNWFDKQGFCKFMRRIRGDQNFHKKQIVVCSSEGDGPYFVYCALDCMLDKEDDLDECIKRLERQNISKVSKKKNMQRLKACWEYVSQTSPTHFQRTLSANPRSCYMYIDVCVSTIAFVVIIICIIIIMIPSL